MYAVSPGAAAAWGRLLAHAGEQAGVALDVVAHAYPAPLAGLWDHPRLGCAFMCGWPLALEDAARAASGRPLRPVIAAPVPDAAWSAGQPAYRSDFVVAAGAPFQGLEDTFGQRFAYNARSSHSGMNLPRASLSRWSAQAPLFRALVGPLTTPRRCIEAVLDGRAEVTAVDSYALHLLCRHDPALGRAVRVVGSSEASPIPPLVGGPALPEDARAALCAALIGLRAGAVGRGLLADLCLQGFAPVERGAYRATLVVTEAARVSGYPELQ